MQVAQKQIIFPPELFNEAYLSMLHNRTRYEVYKGGAGSGKSVAIAQKCLIKLLSPERRRILLCRKTATSIRESQFRQIQELAYLYGLDKFLNFTESTMRIESKINRHNDAFPYGLDKVSKVKSVTGVTDIWVEEADEIQLEDMMQLGLRIRGKSLATINTYKQIMVSFNPVSAQHWLKSWIEKQKNIAVLTTTYKDNIKNLEQEYIDELENLINMNENYYRIYVLGEWGTLDNVIYKPFPFKDYPTEFDEIIYGLDFGYTFPSCLLEIGIKDGEYYPTEIIYEKNLTNQALIKRMEEKGVSRKAPIYCDSAEPDRIQELYNAGFNAKDSKKDVISGIDAVRASKVWSKEENVNLNKEVGIYVYQKDKDGNNIEAPVKANDHALDPLRYAIFTHSRYVPMKIGSVGRGKPPQVSRRRSVA